MPFGEYNCPNGTIKWAKKLAIEPALIQDESFIAWMNEKLKGRHPIEWVAVDCHE